MQEPGTCRKLALTEREVVKLEETLGLRSYARRGVCRMVDGSEGQQEQAT